MQLTDLVLSPAQQRAERARLKELFFPPEPSRQPPLKTAKPLRQLVGVGEPYRAELNAPAAAVLEEWPEVAPAALFSASRDADDLEAKHAFLTLARRIAAAKGAARRYRRL
jgi:hypothetical protein